MHPIQPRPDQSSRPLDLKAVVTGAVVDISGTLNSEILAGLVAATLWWTDGWTGGATLLFYLLNLARGLGFTALGGYFSARLAKGDPMTHALLSGIISQLISIGFAAMSFGQAPLWYTVLCLVSIVPAALLGGFVHLAMVGTQPVLSPGGRKL
jgi:hypothetical protein